MKEIIIQQILFNKIKKKINHSEIITYKEKDNLRNNLKNGTKLIET